MPEKTTQKGHGKKTAPPSEKEVQPEVVIQIPLAELHPFPDHPSVCTYTPSTAAEVSLYS